ncbi:MAG: hypothetical protein SNF33_00845 [Candidatus Algichlamydia australiensis]|nr:hypothetical protein [Chlamydiales bacterium]
MFKKTFLKIGIAQIAKRIFPKGEESNISAGILSQNRIVPQAHGVVLRTPLSRGRDSMKRDGDEGGAGG